MRKIVENIEEMEEIEPEGHFASQREGEEVQFILFKHWAKLALPILMAFVIIIVSLVIPIWANFMGFIFRYSILALVYYLWQVYWVLYMVYVYICWYQGRVIITDQRVINITQKGLFRRRVSEVDLTRVQNVRHDVNGLLAMMFNFGTVTIESAGASEVALIHIGDPAGVQEIVTRLVKEATVNQPASDYRR
jgi:uncharacterized membrane protein YdbT with pleckstrin-like domain